MKKTLLLLSVSQLFISCGPSRKSIESNSRAVIEALENIRFEFARESHEKTVVSTDLSEGEEIATETVEFDTTLPPDPETGLAPVKQKTTQTKRKTKQVQQLETTDRATVTEATEETVTMTQSETTAETNTKSQQGLNAIQSVLCLIGLSGIAWLTIRLVRQFKT